ncbi:Zinc finger protein 12 [Liparis tanakae]|uniref:Zinc finger protein 12 n=1 Tax=Liparis tanakae TaxID=230148 RepID=A0A4Z2HG37_9TELE|nr:Zinc finger protein 12 [Liparis tanakae]
MERVKIEEVIVGNDKRAASAEIKPESVVAPLQPYQHESLQCFQCFITFCNSKAKERHMRKSHRDQYKQHLQQTDTVFTCYKCDKSFSFSEELSQHQATHSTEEKPFLCAYCQKNFFTFTELNKHRRHECVERRCPCRDCGTLFPSPSRLRNHRLAAHPQRSSVADDINTYQCCKCTHSFKTEEELLQHQETFASDINCGVKPQGKKRGRKPKNAAQGGTVESKKVKEEDEDEEEDYNDSTMEDCPANELQPELKIPCSEANCDLIFSSLEAIRAHKRDAHGPFPHNPHTCTECDESYAEPEQLTAHVARDHHPGSTCPISEEGFEQDSTLEIHPISEEGFEQDSTLEIHQSTLEIHQNTHTEGEVAAEMR